MPFQVVGSWDFVSSKNKPVTLPFYFPESHGVPLGLSQLHVAGTHLSITLVSALFLQLLLSLMALLKSGERLLSKMIALPLTLGLLYSW